MGNGSICRGQCKRDATIDIVDQTVADMNIRSGLEAIFRYALVLLLL